MDAILAIDQGTHASRAMVFDGQGRLLAQHSQAVSLARPRPDQVEQDAGEILASVQQCVSAVLDGLDARRRAAIGCCGIATQRSTVLAWDGDGTPAGPALNWQDTRGASGLEALRPRAGEIRRISGLPLSAHYGASKLRLLEQRHPEPGIHLGPLAAFLVHRLSGGEVFAVDHSNAQRMQLFDIRALDWSQTLCEGFGVSPEKLPPCRPVCAAYGRLGGNGIPVTAVCGDQNAAWFGGGAPDDDSALINLGSGAFVMAGQAGDAGIPELLSSIACSDAQHCEYVAEGTVNGAGNALQWLQDNYAVPDIESRLAGWLQQVQAPPLFLNTVGGLGSPWWQQGPAPRFADDPANLTAAEMAAGVAESILFLLQHNIDCLRRQRAVRRLRVSGGLSQPDALCQKLANLSGCPVQRCDQREASARGVAWLAAGRPAQWQAQDHAREFLPRADAALEARYRRFLQQLRHDLEADSHA